MIPITGSVAGAVSLGGSGFSGAGTTSTDGILYDLIYVKE